MAASAASIYAGAMNQASPAVAETRAQPATALQLSVVVPTFNERDNVEVLFRKLEAALAGVAWEVIFVDDNSPDGTWSVVRELALREPRVRCIRRIGRRGLAGACIEGILAASAPFVAVMDADLQHDETLLAKMLGLLESGNGRSRGRQPLRRRAAAPTASTSSAPASARWRPRLARKVLQGRHRRSDERLLHDPPRSVRRARAAALDPGLQDPARRRRHRAAAACASSRCRTPSARGCTARASSTRWSRWTSSAWCWRNSATTSCRCASSCSRWSARPACSCTSSRCSWC